MSLRVSVQRQASMDSGNCFLALSQGFVVLGVDVFTVHGTKVARGHTILAAEGNFVQD